MIPRINTKTYEKMFKICANSKGEIVKGTNEDGSKIFTRFWRGVAMIFKPTIGTSTGSTANYKLEPGLRCKVSAMENLKFSQN